MADIFKEVEEDLRRERLEQLWQRYGRAVIAVAVLIVLGTAGSVAWHRYQQHRQSTLAEQYGAAIAETDPSTGDLAKADAALANIADAGGGYGALARLEQAAVKAKAGDLDGAAKIYDTLASDSAAPPALRDLAKLLKVMRLVDSGDPAALTDSLAPLMAPESPWRFTATELTAILALKSGDQKRATDLFTQLADDQAAPSSLRARAAEMAAALKG
ncbi:MAG TPA: tetratricopeptide repeat protein [Hypericibacter adhaerens]|uniref:Membrane protein n=1 Tax=Hypericibacter adhaerens TaxID=2602016 RepID=A0A5J6N2L3_9PROT|nr:tetratricopeptide repeat protein [Hypericibacter adhaerens]QEX23183.1 membrane protein [Hypericibacter adhaerens]HWA44654.1 tetratricopeptide repeat protein [Hypericibacter adhaerens]